MKYIPAGALIGWFVGDLIEENRYYPTWISAAALGIIGLYYVCLAIKHDNDIDMLIDKHGDNINHKK